MKMELERLHQMKGVFSRLVSIMVLLGHAHSRRKRAMALVVAFCICILFTPDPFSMLYAASQTPLAEIHEKAVDGDAGAQYHMGHISLKKGGQQDLFEAERWFYLAASQQHAKAMYWLGKVMSRKPETPENDKRILGHYRKAAELGEVNANYELGLINLTGSHGLKKNIEVARIRFERAAARDHIMANATLVAMTHENLCRSETGRACLRKIEKWAQADEAQAQYSLGQIYEYGYIVPQDYQKALTWYDKAANKGITEAWLQMGYLHENGLGTVKDNKKAMQCFITAANKGETSANYHIAQMYEKGLGVAPNNTKAFHYYKKAAVSGHLKSISRCGVMAAIGKGIEKNEVGAVKWLMPAAARGDADAQYSLGRLYKKGVINAELENTDNVKKWVKLVRGQYYDENVHANDRVAKQLFERAAAQGHEKSIDYLEKEGGFKGWFFLIFGIFMLPISVGIFLWPEVVAELPRRGLSLPHHPVIIRYLSAPLLFLFSLGWIYFGVQALGWFG